MSVDAAVALVTLAEARVHLRLGQAPLSDDEITRLERGINDASTWFANRVGRPLILASQVERHDGRGGTTLYLRGGPPVTAVESLTIDGEAIPEAASETEDGYELISGDAEPHIILRGYVFTTGTRNVLVSRLAGWDPAAVPEDVKGAVLQLIALRWAENDRNGAMSTSLGGGTATWSGSPIFANIAAVADSHRRHWL